MSAPQSVGLIWAQTLDGVIGFENAIPWHVPEDMANFKTITMGHPVVMGRRTWDSLPVKFRPLTGRRNIVVTRQADWSADGAERAGSVDEALTLGAQQAVWVIGGGQIYSAAMPFATELLVTEVDASIAGDAYAPPIGPEWQAPDDAAWQTSTTGLRYRIRRYAHANSD